MENEILSIRVYGIPKPQARPRIFMAGKFSRAYSPKTDWFGIVYAEGLKAKPAIPWDFPIYLYCKFIFPRPKNDKKGYWKATRPDADNLCKAVLDSLTNAGWWADDGRICSAHIEKILETPQDAPGAVIYATRCPDMENERPPARCEARGLGEAV